MGEMWKEALVVEAASCNTLLVGTQGTSLYENKRDVCIAGGTKRSQAAIKEKKNVMFFILQYCCLFVGGIHVCNRALKPEGRTQGSTL